MWLQKRLNKRLIKRAIGSEYVYEIEADERIKKRFSDSESNKTSSIKSFIQWWVNEIKREINNSDERLKN